MTSKADRWKQRGKRFTKNWFLIAFFSITKNVFHYLLAKFFLRNPDACDLQPAVSNFAAHGQELLVQYWNRSKPHDVSWLFWIDLNQTLQDKLFQELRIHLSANSYLWSLHLVVNTLIVKTMLNSWSQLLKKSAWKRSLLLTKTHFICASKLIAFATFSSRTDQLKFCPGIQLDDECNLFTLMQRLFHVLTYMYIFLPNLSNPFPANHCSAFSYSHPFSCALYSDDSSWQTSDEKLRKY